MSLMVNSSVHTVHVAYGHHMKEVFALQDHPQHPEHTSINYSNTIYICQSLADSTFRDGGKIISLACKHMCHQLNTHLHSTNK